MTPRYDFTNRPLYTRVLNGNAFALFISELIVGNFIANNK